MSFSVLVEGKLDSPLPLQDAARFPDAGWLDGTLVMDRLDALAELRELRLTRRPKRRAFLRIVVQRHRISEVLLVASSGSPEVDEALIRLYQFAEAPFSADGDHAVVLHPPSAHAMNRFSSTDVGVAWPSRVQGPNLVDRDCAARELGRPKGGGAVELELELDRRFVRWVRLASSCGDPAFDAEAIALFRRAELRYFLGQPETASALVRG